VPITYVPARNTIFLSFALAWAEILGVVDVYVGVNAIDYSGYPDCRPEFIAAFEAMANLATKIGVEGTEARRHGGTKGEEGTKGRRFRVHTPLIKLSKGEIILRGVALGVDYSLTHSCYDPAADGRACGHCDSCVLRKKGFAQAGVADPTRYFE
jgi:7-cyano-7-deazaguanine synthase